MSGIEVVGLISAIIGIIDASLKVYGALKDASGLPQSFREVASRLPLVQDTLRTALDGLAENQSKESYDAIKLCLEDCEQKIKALEKVFREVVPPDDASGAEKFFKAIKATAKGEKVQTLMKGILEDLQALTVNHALRAATRAQMKELIETVEKAQAQDNSGSPICTYNTGSGTQIIYSGEGDQNISGGPQFRGVFNGPFNFSAS